MYGMVWYRLGFRGFRGYRGFVEKDDDNDNNDFCELTMTFLPEKMWCTSKFLPLRSAIYSQVYLIRA